MFGQITAALSRLAAYHGPIEEQARLSEVQAAAEPSDYISPTPKWTQIETQDRHKCRLGGSHRSQLGEGDVKLQLVQDDSEACAGSDKQVNQPLDTAAHRCLYQVVHVDH